jgi:hypothetical protein
VCHAVTTPPEALKNRFWNPNAGLAVKNTHQNAATARCPRFRSPVRRRARLFNHQRLRWVPPAKGGCLRCQTTLGDLAKAKSATAPSIPVAVTSVQVPTPSVITFRPARFTPEGRQQRRCAVVAAGCAG